MDFKKRMRLAKYLKYAIVFCLILLFLWWGRNAVLRYWSQPLSTDISYKYGETQMGVQFPQVTLCQPSFYEDQIFMDCHNGSWNLLHTFASCMKTNKINPMQNFHPEIGNIVEMVRLWTGAEYVSLWPLYGNFWKQTFLLDGPYAGPCYMFDLSKVEKFKYVSLEAAGGTPGIEFAMAENNLWQKVVLLLHTRFDLPDAYKLNGYIVLSLTDKIKQAHRIELRKKINKRESTRKEPCVKDEQRTCQSIENNKAIFEKFGCSIPILYAGEHLDNFMPKDMSNCSHDTTLEALDFYLKKTSNCSMIQTCENVRFKSTHKAEETWLENKTLLYVGFENPEVEYHHSYISYNLNSLIGEIGGLLGLTLGASALTLFESLFMRIPYH